MSHVEGDIFILVIAVFRVDSHSFLIIMVFMRTRGVCLD